MKNDEAILLRHYDTLIVSSVRLYMLPTTELQKTRI